MDSSSFLTSFRRIAPYFDSHLNLDAIWMLGVLEVGFVRGKTNHKMSRKIGYLIHLRYLGLRGTGISELPASIGNLQNLLILDLRNNNRIILPGELSKL